VTAPWLLDFKLEEEAELNTQGPDKGPKFASFLGLISFLLYSPDITAG